MDTIPRTAVLEDVDRALGLYEWLFEPPGARPPRWDPRAARRRLAAAIEEEDSAVLVGDAGADGLVGLLTAYLDIESVRYGSRCWVEDLVVHPDHRSAGIGGALLDAAGDWARDRGATHLELDTGLARTDAQRFYDRREPATTGYSYSWRL